MIRRRQLGQAALVSLATAIGLIACSPEKQAPAPPAPTYAVVSNAENYIVRSTGNSEIEANGNVYSVRRTEAGQGLSILPADAARPLMLDFGVTGDVANVRAFRAGRWHDLPRQDEYSVRVGPNGALHLMIFPTMGGTAVVTLESANYCDAAPESPCPALILPNTP